jgi:hypothetical protein
MCLKVASGRRFLDRETAKSGCLYLALEDSYNRLQSRMKTLLKGLPAPSGFDFAITAGNINNGIIQQLTDYVTAKPETKLIVIDTLQKVRTNTRTEYSGDYADIGALKSFADAYGICVLLVHHTRKAKDDDDIFNTVSGTTGIIGSADTIIVLSKDKRKGKQVLMSITGRDVEQDELMIELDENFQWQVTGSGEDYEALKNEAHRPANERNEAEQFLIDYLGENEMPSKVVINAAKEKLGISEITIKRAKSELNIKSFQRGRVWFWSMNEPETSEYQKSYTPCASDILNYETASKAPNLLALGDNGQGIKSDKQGSSDTLNDTLTGRGIHRLFEED